MTSNHGPMRYNMQRCTTYIVGYQALPASSSFSMVYSAGTRRPSTALSQRNTQFAAEMCVHTASITSRMITACVAHLQQSLPEKEINTEPLADSISTGEPAPHLVAHIASGSTL